MPVGLLGVYSHVWKSASSWRPDTCSARATNCAVVTFPPECSAVQRFSRVKNAASPMVRRRTWRAVSYTHLTLPTIYSV